MDTAAGFEFIISDADPPWWLETGSFYSVNGFTVPNNDLLIVKN
jgi:hypothetical protein